MMWREQAVSFLRSDYQSVLAGWQLVTSSLHRTCRKHDGGRAAGHFCNDDEQLEEAAIGVSAPGIFPTCALLSLCAHYAADIP